MNAPASPAGPRTPHTYDAFISYSHRADTDLAPHLRAALHRLAKPWYRTRALRVFLDEAALSAEPALWAGIERALSRSGAFILLLSPEAARSPWVNREVEHWVRSNGTDRLLLVLTAGDVAWSDTANGFDRSASSAVPEALYGAFASEPRHVDLRWAAGRTDLDLRNLSFLDAVAELAAPLHGVAKDELVGSDLREHRRAVWLMRIVIRRSACCSSPRSWPA